MEENVLKDFETFEEFPEYYICISEKSNCFYIKKDDKNFVAWRCVDLISYDGKSTEVVLEYNSIIDGSTVLVETIIESKEGIKRNNGGATIKRLSDILHITGNKKSYLDKNDIFTFVNFKEECALDHGNASRKYLIQKNN